MNQTASVSHQVKCQSTKTIKVRLPQPLFRALINFCRLWQLRVSWELGCWALLCALTHSAPELKRLHRGAPELHLFQLFVQPGFSGHVCAGELRSPTPGVLGEEQHAGAVGTFHSHHVVFGFFLLRVRNVSEKCNLMLINLTTRVTVGLRDPPLRRVVFESW